jgi:two-component system, NarL family, captular synthesis response regulator RcsB
MSRSSFTLAHRAATDADAQRAIREYSESGYGQSGAALSAVPDAADGSAIASAPVRVILADDHPIVLYALESLLANYSNLQVVARALSVPELLEAAAQHPFDLVLMDLYMAHPGDLDGPQAIRTFRQAFPQKAVVVLTMECEASVLRKAIDLKVSAVLSKRDRIDLIPVAIASAMAREHYVGPVVRDLLEQAEREERRDAVRRILTRRELEVLTHYAAGRGVTEIAGLLGRSVKTVSAQKCAAMKKLVLSNDIELYRFAVECGVTPERRS